MGVIFINIDIKRCNNEKSLKDINLKENRVYINDILYVFALSLYIIYNFSNSSTLTILKSILNAKIVSLIVLWLIFLSMLYKNINLKNKTRLLLFLSALGVIIMKNFNSGKINYIFIVLFIVSLSKKNLKYILKSIFYTYLTLLLISFCLAKLNIIENVVMIRDLDNGDINRYGLGLIHPNTFFIYYFAFISLYIHNRKKITMLSNSIILIISYYIYSLTNSRTGLIIIVLLLILDWIFSKININNHKILRKILIHFFGIFTIGNYLITVYGDISKPIYQGIDSLLSHRLQLTQGFYSNYGIKLFGNTITYKSVVNGVINNKQLVLDNTYMYLLIDMGLLFTIMIYLIYYFLMKKLIYLNLNKEVVSIIIFMIYALTERVTVIQFNWSILIFFYLINWGEIYNAINLNSKLNLNNYIKVRRYLVN